MGSRMLQRWIHQPLRNHEIIRARQASIEELLGNGNHEILAEDLKALGDIERIAARIALRNARPRDFARLRQALALLPQLQQTLTQANAPHLQILISGHWRVFH